MRALATFLAIAATLAFARAAPEIEEEDDVLVLDDSNFDDAISAYDPLLVEFYAPWCGHCKRLAPEYAKAAAELKQQDLRIAKVDATANDDLARRFNIQGFPTLKFFKGGNEIEYGGGRTADAIVSWVSKKSGPAYVVAETVEEAQEAREKADVVVFGFFGALEGEAFEAFERVASGLDDVNFVATSSPGVRAELGVEGSGDAIVLFKAFDEGKVTFSGDLTSSTDVETFVRDNELPLVIKFSSETAPKIFGGSVKIHVLIMADEAADGFEDSKATWAEAAKDFRGRALFIWVPPSEDRILSYFDVTADDLPTAVVVRMDDAGMKKFAYPHGKDVDGSKISAFVEDVLGGSVSPTLKSEEPEDSDLEGPVAVVRGKTFEDIVLDADKDVLLEFYAPWCGHCKALAPTYDELGAKMASSDGIVIAKMDATANEIDYEGVNVRGFPTLYFFPASKDGSPKKAVEYDGSRELDGFVSFLKKNAVNPVVEDDAKDEL